VPRPAATPTLAPKPGVPGQTLRRAPGCGDGADSLPAMDVPPPDPAKLLAHWMEWERGETPPGRVMSSLKTGGLREVLEALIAQSERAGASADG
jgi:hypothetical protein